MQSYDDPHHRCHPLPGALSPGRGDTFHLRLLLTLCRVSDPLRVAAPDGVLVRGLSRREACERHGVSQSHPGVHCTVCRM